MPCQKNRPDANKNLGQEFNLTAEKGIDHTQGQVYGTEAYCLWDRDPWIQNPVTFFKPCDHGLNTTANLAALCAEWGCNALHTATVEFNNRPRRAWTQAETKQLFPLFFLYVKDSSWEEVHLFYYIYYLLPLPWAVLISNGKKWWAKQRQFFCMLCVFGIWCRCLPTLTAQHASPDSPNPLLCLLISKISSPWILLFPYCLCSGTFQQRVG